MANAVLDKLVDDYLASEDPTIEAQQREEKVELFKQNVALKSGNKNLKGIVPGLNTDLFVTELERDKIPPEIRDLIPQVNELYLPDIDALTAVVHAVENNEPSLITGPTGCGKSELLAYICAHTNRPFIRLNMVEDIDSSMVFGMVGAVNGQTYWEDGPAAEAGIYGAFLNIDEYDAAPAGIMMGFQWLLEHNNKMYLKEKPGTSLDKTIDLHENFRISFTGNTLGQGDDTGHFAGTQVQNTAMLDRLRTSVQMDYLPPEKELQVLKRAHPEMNEQVMKMMIQVANNVRNSYKKLEVGLTMSPRTLLNWCAKCKIYKDPMVALTYAYLNKLRTTDRKLVTKLYERSFGTKTQFTNNTEDNA